MRRALLLLVAALVLSGAACQRDRSSTGTPGNPFTIVVSRAHATPETGRELETALSGRSGLTVRVRVEAPGADAVGAAGMQGADAGLLPIFEYLLARQEFGVRAGLQVLRGDASRYSGVLVVKEGAAIRTLADLKGRKVAFVDRTSTAGYLLPLRALAQAGVEVTPVFSGSHEGAMAALAAGEVDAAATFGEARTGLRVLAETGTVPNEPVFFSAAVLPEAREKVTRALVDFAATPEGRALFEQLGGITGFAPVIDGAYDEVHDLLGNIDRSVADLVPGGRHLVDRRNAPLDIGPH